jgi:hypothetical protein
MSGEAKTKTALSRASLDLICRTLEDGSDAAPAWNVVDVLELLIDAGHFLRAKELSQATSKMVSGDGRERLFDGYALLCELMDCGEQTRCLQALELLYLQIHNGGHSAPDKVRTGLLLARALAICVSVGSLSQRSILRARSILSVELDRLRISGDIELEAQVVTELAKCYLHAPTEDLRAAQSILDVFIRKPSFSLVTPERAFDLKRVLFQAEKRLNHHLDAKASEELLRLEAHGLGGVERALAELTICRGQQEVDLEQLQRAAEIFEANDFLSAAFEANFVLAVQALERGHNVVARRHWLTASAIASRAGFLHGRLLANLGLYQSALMGEDLKRARLHLDFVEQELNSEMALGSAGLNFAAAQQIAGIFDQALETAKRCESFFEQQNLVGFQAQAASIVATCEAHAGRWERARLAWSRAATLDQQRSAFVSAFERQGLVAQALMMRDMNELGQIKAGTVKKIRAMLEKAEISLETFGQLDEALRVRARLQSVHAHLYALCGEHVRGLRCLSSARELFTSLGMELDQALTDALTALSMLEISKASNPALAEEAVMYLQRALQFFSSAGDTGIRWKLLYYLAVGALLVCQSKSGDLDRLKWRDLAALWLRDADKECIKHHASAEGGSIVSGGHPEFAPGLKPADIEQLKRALGLKERSRKRRGDADDVLDELPLRPDGYVH